MLFLAFSLGIMSSFHCVGMCGPIALALPIHKGSKSRQIAGLLSYNLGTTYASLGALIGALGNGMGRVLALPVHRGGSSDVTICRLALPSGSCLAGTGFLAKISSKS